MPETSCVCWNCCALRFESDKESVVCPNCGELVINDLESNDFIVLTMPELLGGLEQDHMNNLVVYTAIFGGYDKIRNPLTALVDGSVDYYMVTEPSAEIDSDVWKRYPIADFDMDNLSPRMRSRNYKMHPHILFPTADITIWHGGNIQMNIDPWIAKEWLGDADIALFKHPHRNCVYAEARTLLEMCKAKREPVKQLVMFLSQVGYPKGNGLAACWFMIRRNNERMRKFNREWWKLLLASETERDQLLFNYMLREMPEVKVKYIPGNLLTSPYFMYHYH